MAKYLHTPAATAILSAALAIGGASLAAAHHGDVSDHSTTKGKSLSEIEMKERQITAELNRKQVMSQIAFLETPMAQAQITQPQPMTEPQAMPSEMPAAMPAGDQAAVMPAAPADAPAEEANAAP